MHNLNRTDSTLKQQVAVSLSHKGASTGQGLRYKVVFWGQGCEGVSRNALAKAFARQFKIRSLNRLRHYFTGRLVVLKDGLPEARARALVELIKSLGGECRMEQCGCLQLQGEPARRQTPSFLQKDFDPSQLALAPQVQEAPTAAAGVARRNPFEARDL
ncbi:hypothetical protein L1F30_11335 [Simiduia sp. 21SJ11W-1]|uniref:hypothetical protein n=1 Tax=Simiduia sp. 21SJ11W-1 TaxID=2909669 RepID=UPI00209FC7E5|nr:hypothetical protein [Simiduia sp. 21SJ11W-1]UTA46755.1 hypothetical protein L1F30_11335 [Simiduia sp. 21SJ11W-1]